MEVLHMRVDEKREQIEERKANRKRKKRIVLILCLILAVCAGCVTGYMYRDKIQKLIKRAKEIEQLKKNIDSIKEKVIDAANNIGESVNDAIF